MPFVPDEEPGRFVPDEAPKAKPVAPTKQEGYLSQIGSGLAKTLRKTSRGIGTFVLPEAAEKWAEAHKMLPTEAEIKQREALMENQPLAKGTSTAAEIGLSMIPAARTASFLMKAPTIATQAAREAAALGPTLMQRLASGVGAGAAGSLASGGDVEQGAITGGAIDALLPPATRFAGKVGRGLRDVFQGVDKQASRYLQNIFGDRAPAVVQALRAQTPELAGETITAGKKVGAQFPEVKVLEERARNSPIGRKFNEIEAANVQARVAPLEAMAAPGRRVYDPVTNKMAPSVAQALREAETKPLYAAAGPNRTPLTPELEEIIKGAEMQPAVNTGARGFQQAQTNAAVEGLPRIPGLKPSTPEIPAEYDTLGMLRKPAVPGTVGSVPIDALQEVRRSLDDKIADLARTGSDSAKLRRLTIARQQLSNQMETASPTFAQANAKFKELSAPQNQAEVADVLRGAMEKGSKQFVEGMANAPQTIKKADLSPRFGDLRQVMSPQQMATLDALRGSAQREAGYAATNAPEGMVPQAQSVIERGLSMAPPLFNRAASAIRKALTQTGSTQDTRIKQIINEAMLNPDELARLIESVPPAQRGRLSSIIDAIPKGAGIGAFTSQTTQE